VIRIKQIILAFSDLAAAQKIRTLLSAHGMKVAGTLSCISQVILLSKRLEGKGGVVIGQLRLSDGICYTLAEYLPADFDILILTKQAMPSMFEDHRVTTLSLPVKPEDLIATARLLTSADSQGGEREKTEKRKPSSEGSKEKRIRTEEEIRFILEAKELLMQRNHLTEEQAHRFLQKKSMDSGMLLHDTAKLVLEKW
jgi:two-component system, response regulator PdtaR